MTVKNNQTILFAGFGDLATRTSSLLAEKNYPLLGINRSKSVDSHILTLPSFTHYQADFTNLSDTQERIKSFSLKGQSPDVVVVTFTPASNSPEGYEQGYKKTTENLISALQKNNLRPYIIWISSTSVYTAKGSGWCDETTLPIASSWRGERLLEAEQQLIDSDLEHTIIRAAGIYGNSYRALVNAIFTDLPSASSHPTNRIHRDDLAGLIAYLIDDYFENDDMNKQPKLVVACDGEAAPFSDFVQWVQSQAVESSMNNLLKLRELLRTRSTTQGFISRNLGQRNNNTKRIRSLIIPQLKNFRLRYQSFREGYADSIQSLVKLVQNED